MDQWTTIRYLHAQGTSIRVIAHQLGVARNTVRAALRSEDAPRYQRPARPNPQLVPFIDQIERMLFEQRFIGSRILRELRTRGYDGGKTALNDYLRTLATSQPDHRITERFETAPGQQGQFDWSPYTIALGVQSTRVIVFSLTLAYSRCKFFWPSLDETQHSIYEAIAVGMHHFGGVPKELLIDNAGSLVSNAHPAHFRWNTHFLELCGHYALKPVACQPGRPQTKGKVERPFSHLEEQLIKGNHWPDLATFTTALAVFAGELDHTIHGTTRERPIDRFVAERAQLTALPTRSFMGTYQALRTVSWDCLVSYGGTHYSVPWQHAGTRVWVRSSQGVGIVVMTQAGDEVAQHAIPSTKGLTVIDQAHYAGLRAGLPTTKRRVIDVFLARFPDHEWFVEELYQQFPQSGAAPLRAVLGLAELYPQESLRAAFVAARRYHSYGPTFIRGVLEAGGARSIDPLLPATAPVGPPSLSGDLQVYQRVLEATR